MKQIYSRYLTVVIILALSVGFGACSSDDNENDDKNESQIEDILYDKYVTADVEETISKLGVTINRGINPPNIEGYYLLFPWCIGSTYPNDPKLNSTQFYDHPIHLYNQSGLKIDLISYEMGITLTNAVKHVGEGAFICGEGNKFSVLFEEINTVKKEGKTYTQKVLTIFSGEVVRNEKGKISKIKDFKYVFFVKDNGGSPNSLPNNTGRLFIPDKNNRSLPPISKEYFDKQADKFNSISSKALRIDSKSYLSDL